MYERKTHVVHAAFVTCLVSPLLGLRTATPPVCSHTYLFSSHQATYDNRNEYVTPTLPYLTNTTTCSRSIL
jgi:hypothetical protein